MPELPEVETVCRGLAPAMEGRRFEAVLVRRRDLRIPLPADFERRLTGRRVTHIGRRAKYIVVTCDDGTVVLVHLGMSGRMMIVKESSKGAETHLPGEFAHQPNTASVANERGTGLGRHDHVIFTLEGGVRIVFNDHRRFGLMALAQSAQLDQHHLLESLGVEPLGNHFTPAYLAEALQGRKTPIKAALLNQHIVAGIGNIYACEALFRAGLSPRRSAHTIGPKRSEKLVPAIQSVLAEAIEAGGSTLRDYTHADGELGYFQHTFAVYDRAGADCRTAGCPGQVKRIVQSNRSTFFCGRCQK